MKFIVKISMAPVVKILRSKGLTPDGAAQQYLTADVSRRMTKYMPYRSGALSTKLKIVSGPKEITVLGPYAMYQYYGKAMEGPAPRHVTDRPLNYDTTKNPMAGPFWDRRLMAAEGEQIGNDLAAYIERGDRK